MKIRAVIFALMYLTAVFCFGNVYYFTRGLSVDGAGYVYVSEGYSVTANLKACGPYSYQWQTAPNSYSDFTDIKYATDTTYVATGINNSFNNKTYRCKLTNTSTKEVVYSSSLTILVASGYNRNATGNVYYRPLDHSIDNYNVWNRSDQQYTYSPWHSLPGSADTVKFSSNLGGTDLTYATTVFNCLSGYTIGSMLVENKTNTIKTILGTDLTFTPNQQVVMSSTRMVEDVNVYINKINIKSDTKYPLLKITNSSDSKLVYEFQTFNVLPTSANYYSELEFSNIWRTRGTASAQSFESGDLELKGCIVASTIRTAVSGSKGVEASVGRIVFKGDTSNDIKKLYIGEASTVVFQKSNGAKVIDGGELTLTSAPSIIMAGDNQIGSQTRVNIIDISTSWSAVGAVVDLNGYSLNVGDLVYNASGSRARAISMGLFYGAGGKQVFCMNSFSFGTYANSSTSKMFIYGYVLGEDSFYTRTRLSDSAKEALDFNGFGIVGEDYTIEEVQTQYNGSACWEYRPKLPVSK